MKKEITRGYKLCSDISISSVESADLPLQQSNLGEYKQLSLWKSTPTLKQSCDRTSQEYQFTQISETTNQNQESLTSLPVGFPVLAHQTQELEQDLNIQLPLFGEKDLDVLSRLNPASVLLNNLKEFSDEDLELFLPPYIWQDTVSRLKQSRRESLERDTRDSDYLSFPTLTSGQTSTTMRPAGQTKCEKWFRNKGLIPNGSQLGSQAIAMIMGFPPNWFDCLSPTEHQDASEQDTSQDEQLPQDKQRSLSVESCISIPCLVKQPKQPEVKGVIKKDLGDRFIVYIPDSDSTITVSKLFVYPDFSKSVGQINKCSSKNRHETNAKVSDISDKCSSKINLPSKNCSSKTRRLKGEGSGAIFYRTVTRNGRDYQQAYYHWRENDRQRTKYIPKKLLVMVQDAESRKLPVADILNLLGEKQKCSSKSSDICEAVSFRTFSAEVDEKVLYRSDKCSSKIESPSKNQRRRGEGSGSIYWRTIKKNGKDYQQTYYHYEIWEKGDPKAGRKPNRLIKSCEYIPKRMRSRIERMNKEKAPVAEILKILRNRSKRKK